MNNESVNIDLPNLKTQKYTNKKIITLIDLENVIDVNRSLYEKVNIISKS